jgi:hypothetical protein
MDTSSARTSTVPLPGARAAEISAHWRFFDLNAGKAVLAHLFDHVFRFQEIAGVFGLRPVPFKGSHHLDVLLGQITGDLLPDGLDELRIQQRRGLPETAAGQRCCQRPRHESHSPHGPTSLVLWVKRPV